MLNALEMITALETKSVLKTNASHVLKMINAQNKDLFAMLTKDNAESVKMITNVLQMMLTLSALLRKVSAKNVQMMIIALMEFVIMMFVLIASKILTAQPERFVEIKMEIMHARLASKLETAQPENHALIMLALTVPQTINADLDGLVLKANA